MLNWFQKNIPVALARLLGAPRPIPLNLWRSTLSHYPFLAALGTEDKQRLRNLTSRFLADKEFAGAHGLEVSDAMAVAIAAQACLPILYLDLKLYDDFKGIVVHSGPMVARRQMTDAAGVVHHYSEVLAGEAMQGGPVTLSWQDVAASDLAARGHNVVIHDFVHTIDMHAGSANGRPALHSRTAKLAWQQVMQTNYDGFRQQVVMHERFGAQAPWLDSYGAQSPVEFFAVAAEAYFVNRVRFTEEFPQLTDLFDSFFRPQISPT